MIAIAFSAALGVAGTAVARDAGGRGYSTNFGNVGGGAARSFNQGSSTRPAPVIRTPQAAFRPPSYDGPRANYRTNFDFTRNGNSNWKNRQAWRSDNRRRDRYYRRYSGVTPYYGDYYYNSYAYDGGRCGYYLSKWRRTGSSYWRHRYEDCIS